MKITHITVSAARTFNHPYEEYANFKPGLNITVSLDEDDEKLKFEHIRELQRMAEQLMEEYKLKILNELKMMERRQIILNNLNHLETIIRNDQMDIAKLLKEEESDKQQIHIQSLRQKLENNKKNVSKCKESLEKIEENLFEFGLLFPIHLAIEEEQKNMEKEMDEEMAEEMVPLS
jgi:hypothetical protein